MFGQATPALVTRRKAAWAINALCRELGLGTMAIRFDAEQSSEWAVVSMAEVKALKHGREVATVLLTDSTAEIVFQDDHQLIRSKHLKEYNREEYGFGHRPGNWLNEQEPYRVTIQLLEDIPGLHSPHRPMPKRRNHRKFKARGML